MPAISTAKRSVRVRDREFADELALPATDVFATEMDFRVDLNMYRGPLDLLLYLVRKHELDITDIPVSMIADQYLSYLEILEDLSIDEVGDFIEMASLLVEIKSRMVLPTDDEEQEAPLQEDPRDELVQRLLEYKKYKDAASILDESSRDWQQRYPRIAKDLPDRTVDPSEQPIKELELWDLVSAIGRIVREADKLKPITSIVYDDTPISVYMQQMHEGLIQHGELSLTSMFAPGMHKAKMIGVFLAVLELARNYGVAVEQVGIHGKLTLRPSEDFVPRMEISEVFGEFDQTETDLATSKPR